MNENMYKMAKIDASTIDRQPFYGVANYVVLNLYQQVSNLLEFRWREDADPVVVGRVCPAVLHRHPFRVFSLHISSKKFENQACDGELFDCKLAQLNQKV